MIAAVRFGWFPLLCGLGVLLATGTGCDLLRESQCVNDPMLTGCKVTVSVAPSRVPRNLQATFTLHFQNEGIAAFLGKLGETETIRVRLVQEKKTIDLKPKGKGEDGVLRLSVTREQMESLNVGEVQLQLSTDGGSVSTQFGIFAEPKMTQVWSEPTGMSKWAGLRSGPNPKVAMFVQTSMGVGDFQDCVLKPNSIGPGSYKLEQCVVLQKPGSFASQPRVSLNQNHIITFLEVGVFDDSRLVVLANLTSSASPVYMDTASNLTTLVTKDGLVIYADTVKQNQIPSPAPKLLDVQNLTAADLNRDGRRDVLALISESGKLTFRVLLQQEDGSFKEHSELGSMLTTQIGRLTSITGLATGDVDGDRTEDLVVADTTKVYWLPIDGHSVQKELTGVSAVGLVRLEAADLDADGLADLAVVTSNGATLYLNTALR